MSETNKLRNSLVYQDDFISYIMVSYIMVLTANFEQFFAIYLKNEGSVMSKTAHFLHLVVFKPFLALFERRCTT